MAGRKKERGQCKGRAKPAAFRRTAAANLARSKLESEEENLVSGQTAKMSENRERKEHDRREFNNVIFTNTVARLARIVK